MPHYAANASHVETVVPHANLLAGGMVQGTGASPMMTEAQATAFQQRIQESQAQANQVGGGNLDRFHVPDGQIQLVDMQLQPSPKRASEIKTPSDWNVLQQSPTEPTVAPPQQGQQQQGQQGQQGGQVQFQVTGADDSRKNQQQQQREVGYSFGAPATA